jgi:hypothetical protein
MLNEIVTDVYGALSEDATLLSSGINPQTGASRSVRVVGQAAQADPLPFVRVTLTDSALLEPDAVPHDYDTQPTAERVMLLVNVFSDFEPEVRKIAHRVQELLRHRQVVTAGYRGFTWLDSCVFYTDNQSDPDRVLRVSAIRVRATMEQL